MKVLKVKCTSARFTMENVRCEGFKSKEHFCQVYIANAVLVLPHGLDILDCHYVHNYI